MCRWLNLILTEANLPKHNINTMIVAVSAGLVTLSSYLINFLMFIYFEGVTV